MDKNTMMQKLARESYEKGGFASITFGENCLTIDGTTCKKL